MDERKKTDRKIVGDSPSIVFFNDTATTEIYTLTLHDALPISEPTRRAHLLVNALRRGDRSPTSEGTAKKSDGGAEGQGSLDRKSTRLNSSHANISYAVFCLK